MDIKTLEQMSWPERIEWAKENDSSDSSYAELMYLEDEAESWQTCVCGKLDPRIPRGFKTNKPLDPLLGVLGESFADRVEERRWDSALTLINLIEARAIEVLVEQEEQEETSLNMIYDPMR